MTHDIKATVDYIEQLRIEDDDDAFPLALLKEWPSLLPAIRRWMAIEEAALHLREVQCAGYLVSGLTHHKAREALFAALPPRKPSGGEEAR